LKEKSLEMLGFPQVREILAGYTSFAVSRELALALTPSVDVERVSHWLKQSAEARHLLTIEPDFSVGGVCDIREAVVLAARGKTLELETLVDVQRTLTAIRFLQNKVSRLADEVPLLADLSSNRALHFTLRRAFRFGFRPLSRTEASLKGKAGANIRPPGFYY
jgi:DNA mismatch repair protein MutS2